MRSGPEKVFNVKKSPTRIGLYVSKPMYPAFKSIVAKLLELPCGLEIRFEEFFNSVAFYYNYFHLSPDKRKTFFRSKSV